MSTHPAALAVTVISLFPDSFSALEAGIIGRAITNKRLQITHINPRDHSTDPHRRVDDRPYGGGPGMVMRYQPLADAIDTAKKQHPSATVIHLSPQGKPLTQQRVLELAQAEQLILVASRYEGIDNRLCATHIDEELSIGDFVVSGGELPAMLLIDALTRCLPGVLGNPESALQDSFMDGLLDHPHYTRPDTIAGMSVPEVLQSGDHAAIEAWRHKQRLEKTWQKRPDLLKRCPLQNSENAPGEKPSAPLSENQGKE